MMRRQNFFPGLIAVVYVLRPLGLLQKAISEVSNKFFREDFKFRVSLTLIRFGLLTKQKQSEGVKRANFVFVHNLHSYDEKLSPNRPEPRS